MSYGGKSEHLSKDETDPTDELPSCLKLINDLADIIIDINDDLTQNMLDNSTGSPTCGGADSDLAWYSEQIQARFEKRVKHFQLTESCNAKRNGWLATMLPWNRFELDPNDPIAMVRSLASLIVGNCRCQIPSIAKVATRQMIATKATKESASAFFGMSGGAQGPIDLDDYLGEIPGFSEVPFQSKRVREEVRNRTEQLQEWIKKLSEGESFANIGNVIAAMMARIQEVNSMSIESELDTLIPDDLGPMKEFFTTLISHYYRNLHPVIWAQIMKELIIGFPAAMPYTEDQIFGFVSQKLLLNSGPFILKILQSVKPALSPELAEKYQLARLTYPLLSEKSAKYMIWKCVNNATAIDVKKTFSASVGHVVVARYKNKPDDRFVIKMIKPTSLLQSCHEFQTMFDLFPACGCEREFISKMLLSNGLEMNLIMERRNLDRAAKLYPATYKEIFGFDCGARLETVRNRNEVVKGKEWYCMAMTLAQGQPVANLIDDGLMEQNSYHRAGLYRCLDLLVYQFFHKVANDGFYHGDLHAGNVLYDCKTQTLTMIDFGSVGEIDVINSDPDSMAILNVIIQSSTFNYPGVLFTLSSLLNTKCTKASDGKVDTTTKEYRTFQEKMREYQVKSLADQERAEIEKKELLAAVFNQESIDRERTIVVPASQKTTPGQDCWEDSTNFGIYARYTTNDKNAVTCRRDLFPITYPNAEQRVPSFPQVMEEMIAFFSRERVNVAIKLHEFYEFQKAYLLLLGLLAKANYPGHRLAVCMDMAVGNIDYLRLDKIAPLAKAAIILNREKKIATQIKNEIADVRQQRR